MWLEFNGVYKVYAANMISQTYRLFDECFASPQKRFYDK